SRKAEKKLPAATQLLGGDPRQPGPWMDTLATCDGVIHLAGAGVFDQRWSPKYKRTLVDSRILSTQNLVEALRRSPRRDDGTPRALVSTSAVGYYGPHGEEILTEESVSTISEQALRSYRHQYGSGLSSHETSSQTPISSVESVSSSPATHQPEHRPLPVSPAEFMIQLCVDWEAEAQKAAELGVRVTIIRVGIVLDPQGGALAQLLTPFRLGVGGPVGTGQQYMSWIHHEDLVRMYLWALEQTKVSGILNGTAPHPVTNKAFGKALGRALGRPTLMWTPAFVLFLLFGEAAAIVVEGQRVVPQRAMQLGFTFRYPDLDAALRELVAR
ncbi:MAG: TIGR01777 family oxidoreductase, partial [Gemmataceae bacterium]